MMAVVQIVFDVKDGCEFEMVEVWMRCVLRAKDKCAGIKVFSRRERHI